MIRKLGGIYPLATLREMNMDIPAPGGNEWSHDADAMTGMDQYVHLCLQPQHPMEFRARQDGRIVHSVFLAIQPEIILWDGVRFSPDVSNKSGVVHYLLHDALDRIDYEVLFTWMDWTNPSIQQRRQQAEKSEILVPQMIPLELILNMPKV